MTSMEAFVRDVTSKEASAWLAGNKGNRRVRASAVDRYRSEMREGRWKVGQPIMFSGDPINRPSEPWRLLDGQHRLEALSGLDDNARVRMMVVVGTPDDTQLVIDQGVKRNLADYAIMRGSLPYAKSVAAVARTIWGYRTGNLARFIGPSPEVFYKMLDDEPEIIDATKTAHGWYEEQRTVTTSILGALLYLMSQIDESLAHRYLSRIALGLDLKDEDHEYRIRKLFYNRLHRDGRRDRYEPIYRMAVIVRGWNQIRAGQPASEFYSWRRSSSFPEIK